MKSTSSVPQALPQQVIRNRVFHCRMRNRHYEKAYYMFHKIEGLVRSNPKIREIDQLPTLREFSDALLACLENAEAAVFYGKRGTIAPFRLDRQYGILREEVILVHFLRELNSSVRYILNRIETDESLQSLEEELEGYKEQKGKENGGFVNRVLESLSALKETSAEEFSQIYRIIHQRYEIGNKLFSLIQELQSLR